MRMLNGIHYNLLSHAAPKVSLSPFQYIPADDYPAPLKTKALPDEFEFKSTHNALNTTMRITRTFSLTNFAIATSALGFQVFVLYPWHKQLDDDFENMRRSVIVERERSERVARGAQAELLAELQALRQAFEMSR
jgi:hypothetical protein